MSPCALLTCDMTRPMRTVICAVSTLRVVARRFASGGVSGCALAFRFLLLLLPPLALAALEAGAREDPAIAAVAGTDAVAAAGAALPGVLAGRGRAAVAAAAEAEAPAEAEGDGAERAAASLLGRELAGVRAGIVLAAEEAVAGIALLPVDARPFPLPLSFAFAFAFALDDDAAAAEEAEGSEARGGSLEGAPPAAVEPGPLMPNLFSDETAGGR